MIPLLALALSQQLHPCDEPFSPAVVVEITPGSVVGVGFCSDVIDPNGAIIVVDGVEQPVQTSPQSDLNALGLRYYVTTTPIKVARGGAHEIQVKVQDSSGAISALSGIAMFTTPSSGVCDAPFGVEAIAIYPTRWGLAGKAVGSPMQLGFQLVSKSPIVQIQAKINGVLVGRPMKGEDLGVAGAIWFPQPPPGSYKLSLLATNAAGCGREVYSFVDLRINK